MNQRHITINLNPLHIPYLAEQARVVEHYAVGYVSHSRADESLTTYVRRVSFDAFPAKYRALDSERANFRRALRIEIRRLERLGRGGY